MKNKCADCDHKRVGWPAGPWDSEPDREEFQHAGFACLLHRGGAYGAWCGYVGLPPSHTLHGKDYDAANERLPDGVHGGLTYAEECAGAICHVPAPGDPEHLWWFGFDCAHYLDRWPGHWSRADYGEYRDIAYVREETKRLAEQLAAMK